jgi:putative NADH-flavin reductase
MTTIAVFGATGRVGTRVCEYAREAGYDLRLLVRDVSRLGDAHKGAHVTPGSVLDLKAVEATLTGATVVISALGDDNFRAPVGTLSGGMALIVEAGERLGVTRVLSVAGGGILDADDGSGQRRENPRYPEVFRAISAEHDKAWRAMLAGSLEWTVACTPDIVPGERTRQFRNGGSRMPTGGRTISCEDLAGFLVDEVELRQYVNQRVGLAY